MGVMQYVAWKEVGRFYASLDIAALRVVGITADNAILDRRGLFVYILHRTMWDELDTQAVMYVGQTVQTVWARISKHIYDKSPIGRALARDRGLWGSWGVDVVEVDRNLDFAERYYIERFNPVYNHVRNVLADFDIAGIASTRVGAHAH